MSGHFGQIHIIVVVDSHRFAVLNIVAADAQYGRRNIGIILAGVFGALAEQINLVAQHFDAGLRARTQIAFDLSGLLADMILTLADNHVLVFQVFLVRVGGVEFIYAQIEVVCQIRTVSRFRFGAAGPVFYQVLGTV